LVLFLICFPLAYQWIIHLILKNHKSDAHSVSVDQA